ncbi:MAG TPA: carboxypeptidase regulatory-like domain-containing protein [Sphingobacteriaceae bacterium]
MKKNVLLKTIILLLTSFPNGSYAQETISSIGGTVTEKVTGQKIPGAAVTIHGTQHIAITDSLGKFHFSKVKIGKHVLEIKALGYRSLILTDQVLTAGKTLELNLGLDFQAVMMKEFVVNSGRSAAVNSSALVSARGVNMEQANRYAGNFGDISRQVANFAGVNAQGDIRNDIVVRGNSPNNLLWRLEGIDIPNPNHFSFAGTTGGYFSVLNNNMLATSDFMTGAFPSEYGNKNGAVLDVRLKKGNDQKREYTFQAGLNGLELGAEGPFASNNKNTFIAHYRHFDLSGIKKLGVDLNMSGLPSFQDLNFKVHLPNPKGSTSIFGIGGLSSISLLESQSDASDWSFSDKAEDLHFKSNMGIIGVANTYLWNPTTTTKVAFAASGNEINAIRTFVIPDEPSKLKEDLQLTTSQAQLKLDLNKRFTGGQSMKTGLSFTGIFYKHYQKEVNEHDTYDVNMNTNGNTGLAQGYISYRHQYDQITVNTGLYGQYLTLNNTYSIEPRMSISYQMADKQTLAFGFGMHSQSQSLIFYTRNYQYDDGVRQTNMNLKFSRSAHWVLSHEYAFQPDARLKTEVYYQALSRIPVSDARGYYSAVNEGHDYSFEIPENLKNKGTGSNYGFELSFEKTIAGNFYVLGTGSIFNSTFKGGDNVSRNTIFNNNYLANLLTGYEFSTGCRKQNKLSFDVKASFSGGRPYIPVDLNKSIEQNAEVLDYQQAYRKRLPAYNRIDLKVSWLFNRLSSNHLLYAGINNILDSKHIMKYGFNAEQSKTNTEYMQGLFPILGYRIQF